MFSKGRDIQENDSNFIQNKLSNNVAVMQQQLIIMRSQLDNELDRYKKLQYYSQKALQSKSYVEVMKVFNEAFLDILELENSIIFIKTFSTPSSIKMVHEGYRFNFDSRKLQEEIWLLNLREENEVFTILNNETLSEFNYLSNLSRAFLYRIKEENLLYEACFIIGISKNHDKLYNEFDQLLINLFKVISESFRTILAYKIKNNKIQEQNEEININIKRLKENDQRFNDIVFSMADWVWETDTKGIYTYVSKRSKDLLGYEAYEVIGKSLFDFMPIHEQKRLRPIIENIFADRIPIVDLINWNEKKGGKIICLLTSGIPIFDKDHNFVGYRGVDKDITEIKKRQNEISKAIIKAQEEERFELGAELHDNILQILAANNISISMLYQNAHENQKELISNALKNNNLAINEIRNLSHRISPVGFNGNCFLEAFNELIGNLHLDKFLKIEIEIDKEITKELTGIELATNIYRILQEQLKNILKYSKATELAIKLKLIEGNIQLSIIDNGIGFNIQKVKRGIGLENIKRRAEFFKGILEIISDVSKGCVLKVSFPYET